MEPILSPRLADPGSDPLAEHLPLELCENRPMPAGGNCPLKATLDVTRSEHRPVEFEPRPSAISPCEDLSRRLADHQSCA
jgi:hypothetical protein